MSRNEYYFEMKIKIIWLLCELNEKSIIYSNKERKKTLRPNKMSIKEKIKNISPILWTMNFMTKQKINEKKIQNCKKL